ncbi:hypothetical protein RYX36_037249 [Vicia faba]
MEGESKSKTSPSIVDYESSLLEGQELYRKRTWNYMSYLAYQEWKSVNHLKTKLTVGQDPSHCNSKPGDLVSTLKRKTGEVGYGVDTWSKVEKGNPNMTVGRDASDLNVKGVVLPEKVSGTTKSGKVLAQEQGLEKARRR